MSFALHDYACPACGPFEALVSRPAPEIEPCCWCQAPAERLISAPAVHTLYTVGVNRGRDDAKPGPYAMSTRSIAEGQSISEWKKERAKIWAPDRERRLKEALS